MADYLRMGNPAQLTEAITEAARHVTSTCGFGCE
jgi:hypothetical protein